MTTDRTPPKARWWHDPRWLAFIAVAVFLAALLFATFGPDPPIRVSPETTLITSPLAADGLPDYAAALLALAGPTPPAEENAAVDLLRVAWPMGLSPADLAAVCEALGIPNAPPPSRFELPRWAGGPGISLRAIDEAAQRPWTAAERPELAAWVSTHGAFIDRLVAAANKPRFWFAPPEVLGRDASPLTCFLPGLNPRHVVEHLDMVLGCRAMLHVGEGRYGEAWRDLRALARWGRLLEDPQSGPRLFSDRDVASHLREQAALAAAGHLVADPGTPTAILDEIRREFTGVRRIDPEAMLRADHLAGLAGVLRIARRIPSGRAGRLDLVDDRDENFVEPALITRLDWNDVLLAVNRAHDEIVATLRLPTPTARRTRIDIFIAARIPPESVLTASRAANLARYAVAPRLRQDVIDAWYVEEHCLRWHSAAHHVDREEASVALLQTSLALAARRAARAADEPAWPERLDDLVPEHLAAIPRDPCADAPLSYRRDGDGCLLWSVGDDGVDDGGHAGNDMVVRLPAPPRPPFPPAARPPGTGP